MAPSSAFVFLLAFASCRSDSTSKSPSMPIPPEQTLFYKRSRFTTRLPIHYRYDRSHFWIDSGSDNIHRVGLTKFATRMLGDLVEINYESAIGNATTLGMILGTIEGFKAVSDLYCIVEGELIDINRDLNTTPSLMDRDNYDLGWLYTIRGELGDNKIDVHEYASHLNVTVDRLLQYENESKEKTC
jgi:glycine cleavage system H protein